MLQNFGKFDTELSGSTLVVAIITTTTIVLANCGDSRAILIGDSNSILL